MGPTGSKNYDKETIVGIKEIRDFHSKLNDIQHYGGSLFVTIFRIHRQYFFNIMAIPAFDPLFQMIIYKYFGKRHDIINHKISLNNICY